MSADILQTLSAELAISVAVLRRIIATAPRRYKVYPIPKRRGGFRIIAQPSRELKILQRYLLENLLCDYPIHSSAMGYAYGRGIADNARMHRGNDFLLKLDFKDFFPSILVSDWERVVRKSERKLTRAELSLTKQIMFWGAGSDQPYCLSIGAPTSPALSNIVMYELDVQLAAAALKYQVAYSRYADDITISGHDKSAVLNFEKAIRSLIARSKSPKLAFNDEKRGLFGKGERRMVTGLIITPDQQVSIGRERKRLISTMLHKVAVSELDPEQLGKLKGYLGFCISVEPAFVTRMRAKYGNQVVDSVLRAETPKRALQPPTS